MHAHIENKSTKLPLSMYFNPLKLYQITLMNLQDMVILVFSLAWLSTALIEAKKKSGNFKRSLTVLIVTVIRLYENY